MSRISFLVLVAFSILLVGVSPSWAEDPSDEAMLAALRKRAAAALPSHPGSKILHFVIQDGAAPPPGCVNPKLVADSVPDPKSGYSHRQYHCDGSPK